MLKIGVVVVAVLVLSGCASEVDKCVDAYMKSYDLNNVNPDQAKRAGREANVRRVCLAAQSGSK